MNDQSKKVFSVLILVFSVVLILGMVLISGRELVGMMVVKSIEASHINGNVSDADNFNAYLQRDLEAYFSQKYGTLQNVSYELLREAPAQVGLSIPKYYLWITAETDSGEFEGSAVVGAVSKSRFDVIDFYSTDEIQEGDQFCRMVPSDICTSASEKINKG